MSSIYEFLVISLLVVMVITNVALVWNSIQREELTRNILHQINTTNINLEILIGISNRTKDAVDVLSKDLPPLVGGRSSSKGDKIRKSIQENEKFMK